MLDSPTTMVRLDLYSATEARAKCHFSILEMSSFRLVTLLSLDFCTATDIDIKRKLATMVKELLAKLTSLKNRLDDERSKQYQSFEVEEQRVRTINEMRDSHARELAKIKEESPFSLRQMLIDWELKLRESVFRKDTMEQVLKTLQEKHNEQDKEIRRLIRRKDLLRKQVI